ncbi:ribosomal protein S18 acetylase RimI-like enzyme [Hydrogenispora ethanolica]|uniref:Ribosomal protein S18 acetylase RimI-like enzyme n=1 Tax=Hydrogenispora ethanolica TaxID=1082276 RepID=A0A4R1S2S1_HYDET|nr:GNAT family N-acetyltransferase [Hydrogenispora ethanolica]TCL73339.1 ribosomal protein S18 acetylase RimI-like enzyme [Hydrogenispora ethanolica]
MDITIRPAVGSDFPAVFALFHQLWPGRELHEAAMSAVFERGLASGADTYLCAVAAGKVVGFCAYAVMNNFWQEGRIAYIYAMIVDEELRGRGFGATLLRQAIDCARTAGCKRIELDSGFPREGAHRFYERLGFEKRAFLFSLELG